MKGVYIFLADGFEDIEALGTRDILKRGGVDVVISGISDEPFVVSSHGLAVGVDCLLEDITAGNGASQDDVMIFPGGLPGAANLSRNKLLMKMMREHYAQGGTLAAICAAPGLVLSRLDSLQGVEFTCYDGFSEPLTEKGGVFVPKPAVTSGRIITGRGPGHTKAFALAILEKLKGKEKAEEVRRGMDLICV